MVKLNPNLLKLQSNYLFPEVNKRKNEFLQANPDAKLISLSIGDTTRPIPKLITTAMDKAAKKLAIQKTYSGYGPEQGMPLLREQIAQVIYHNKISPQDIFINDGAKCDIGRLQFFFGPQVTVALQDPAYPVYIDGSVIAGQTGSYNTQSKDYDHLVLMPCNPQNHFFPDLNQVPRTDLIYFCSPHNPTGAVATKEQLTKLVAFAKKNKSILIFDAAYSYYIQDPSLPKSIYEIEGAQDVAIEVNSFSKLAGFTGVRLGWTVIPHKLQFDDGQSVQKYWQRFICTIYNGASSIAQYGGLACLSDDGVQEIKKIIGYYQENTKILREALNQKFKTFGNNNAPFIWTYCGEKDSWDYFNQLLNQANIVATPGVGFGMQGQGFMRFSAFGSRKNIETAVTRILKM